MASAKMSVTSTIQNLLLNKSLSSMVKGIRNHKAENGGSKNAETEYINKCLAEIKEELKTNFPDIKAVAIQKLIYLQMIGYDISWSAFHIIELMSSAWFGHKRIGYLAASLSFTKDTDVILLTTHLFRKGFNSSQGGGPTSATMAVEGFQYETGAAISCLANIVTPDLAEGLLADVYTLMNSSRPYIRKKAVLVLLKIFKAWPKALRLSFDRLKEKLEDENQGVVSAAVYVICELASKNPKNYLSLAPQFFKILTTSSNNWVLIKVVKLLGSLVPLEPRLAKKLTEPLTDIISTTPAKSLLYEAVNTLLCGELRSKTVVRLCLEKLRAFIEDQDQNLKYLGLLGLHKLLQKQPRVVSEHKDLILDCLNDEDITIRMRALDLITSMVSLKNLVGIIAKLMTHLDASEGTGHYREHVLERILFICSQDSFAYIQDFEWYVSILVDLTHIQGISRENALRINTQLLDVVVRVPGVRSYTIKQMINILLANRLTARGPSSSASASGGSSNNNALASTTPGGPRTDGQRMEGQPTTTGQGTTHGHMSEVLHAVGFIIGEYTEYLAEQDDDFYFDLLSNMLSSSVLHHLPGKVQNVMIQNVIKVFSFAFLQPFDNHQVKDQLSTVKATAQSKKKDNTDDDNTTAGDGDELAPEAQQKPTPAPETEEEFVADEEEEDFDSYGLRRRKHPSLKRTFEQWHALMGRLLNILYTQLPLFTRAESVEVQERSVAYLQFVKFLIQTGEFEGKITGWKASGMPPQPSAPAAPSASVTATPKSAPAPAPVQQVAAKLDLLSLDPFSASNKQELSIFDMVAPSAPPAPVAAASVPEPLFGGNPSPSAVGGAFSAGLKEKLRSLAIQFGLLYSERLNPVHPKAQKKVQLPKGLDLDAEINPGAVAQVLKGEDRVGESEESEDEDDNPYSTKPKKHSSKPKGGLYDDDEFPSGGGGFGAKQPKSWKSKGKSSGKDDYSSSSGAGSGFLDDDSSKRPLTQEEKDEARKRQERRKQAQASDPYYIKDSAASSKDSTSLLSAGAMNVDHIPVKRLEDADLPGLKVVDKNAKTSSSRLEDDGGRRKSTKVFKVLKHADMPEEEEDGESDGEKKGKKSSKDRKAKKSSRSKDASSSKDNSDNDALDMDLTTPLKPDEFIPRVQSYAEKAEVQRKIDEAKSAKDGSGSRKKKDRKKDEKDRDRDGKKSKKDKRDSSPPKSSSSSTATAPASVNLFDLFDPMGGGPSPAAKPAEASRKSVSSPAASPSAAASSSSSVDSSRSHTLFKDSCVKVKYSCSFVSGSSVQVSLEVSLQKDNTKKISSLVKITVELKSGKYVKGFSGSNVKSTDKGCTVTLRDCKEGSTISDRFTVEFNTALERSFSLQGRFSYTTDRDGKGKDGESIDLDIPMSTFVQPKKVSAQEMANILTSSGKTPNALAQSTLSLKHTKVSEVIRNISPLLNVSLVEAVNFTATYFGLLVSNQTSVAVLVKAKKGDESSVSIEIKTTNSKVTEELMEEVKHKIK